MTDLVWLGTIVGLALSALLLIRLLGDPGSEPQSNPAWRSGAGGEEGAGA
jgi:hypothetical protein